VQGQPPAAWPPALVTWQAIRRSARASRAPIGPVVR
jgi:hypothetical protein